ncbi:hypothetical protein B0J18DRAFT_491466 [Chaetomium sp. MPI-SDFR-AT-0129]|nr:hypothetical protein B0J18DRAFT_491466 [Chaetomium sp. MPI-SDFR-AT-0129]
MRGRPGSAVRWLLLSDLHFKRHDLDRVRQTAKWIVAEAERNQVNRAVVCGDLLTSRAMQPTQVLSACYHFIGLLSDVVPRIHILLGNHDLVYRRDYETTALNALNIKRLAPFVSLHSAVSRHEWDGRRVLLLPFREEQNVLTEAVAALNPNEAGDTVAFAHLAINKAITQRYVVGADGIDNPRAINSITHHGLTGPGQFASLARTFTGHFHSHQTMMQEQPGTDSIGLRGSVTYLGSPLQLSWADLYDEQRGVVLFDPETLEHKLLINPHAINYITADLQQVLDDQVNQNAVADKHVMLTGKLTHFKYATARDKLLSLGVRSVRSWTPNGLTLRAERSSFGGLGGSVPASDASVQPLEEEPTGDETDLGTTDDAPGSDPSADVAEPLAESLDLIAEVRGYVESLDLDESLSSRRDELVRVGQHILQGSRDTANQDGDGVKVKYGDFLAASSQVIGARTATELAGPSTHIFVAEPRSLTITNFLGVQNTIHIDFQKDLPRGLTFLVGDNGSGKSTIVEAMVWCQFGQCIRSGLAANDVINDKAGKNCSVTMEFANGYAISRYRKHKTEKNRVVVSLHGEPQPQLEHAETRTTQAAINELLGTDYETYIRTVVLSHESAASFLNSTPTQRRELIEASLGLSMLDRCGNLSRLLLKDIEADMTKVEVDLGSLVRKMEDTERRLRDLRRTQKRLDNEAEEAVVALDAAMQDQERASKEIQVLELKDVDLRAERLVLQKQIQAELADLEQLGREIRRLETKRREMQLLEKQRLEKQRLKMQLLEKQRVEKERLEKERLEKERLEREQLEKERLEKKRLEKERLESAHANTQVKHAESTSWLGQLEQQLSQRLEAMSAVHPTGLRKRLHVTETSILSFLLMAIRRLRCMFRVPNDDSTQGTTSAENDKNEQMVGNHEVDNQEVEDQEGDNQQMEKQEVDSRVLGIQVPELDSKEMEKQEMEKQEMEKQEMANQEAAINGLRRDIENNTSRLQGLRNEEKQNINHARIISDQRDQARQTQKACEALQQRAAIKQSDAATYKHLAEKEQSALNSLDLKKSAVATQFQALAAHRELFVFWSTALAKRTRRGSSPLPSSAKKATTTTTNNFREDILAKSLSQLNTLLMQAVTMLYDDETRAQHAEMEPSPGMMMTMLHSLLDSSAESSTDTASPSLTEEESTIPILNSTLTIHPALSYPKRSSGERKRLDLALFFALLQLARARSPHRAHYVLVDEVFDSLDRAGQAAVVRWCGAMSRAVVEWIVVITHSQVLVEQQRELGEEDMVRKVLVVEARMGKGGTELFVLGRGIGGDGKVEGG